MNRDQSESHKNNDGTGGPLGGVIGCALYREGRRVRDVAVSEAGAAIRYPEDVVWIGVHDPDDDLMEMLMREFPLHQLAVEDARKAHQRPKLEVYGQTLFIALRTAWLEQGQPAFGETQIFSGRHFVITVRHGLSPTYATVRTQCESRPELLQHGEDYIIYAVMDFVVDNYMPVVEALEQEVDAIEDRIFSHVAGNVDIHRIHTLRRDLLQLRRTTDSLAEVCGSLERLSLPVIDEEVRPFFRDVHDHVLRLQGIIAHLMEVITFSFEAHQLFVSASQNDVMKQLAAWGAILAVPTAIAGIYGMNFKYMPELDWSAGYFIVLGTIALLCTALYRHFRRTNWL